MSDSAPFISIRNVSKRFGVFVAVDDVSIDVAQGEFFALLGPSGCGKTTLLRMLAGFESLTQGDISIDGVDMAGVPPNRRPTNMVFQSYAVFPHMRVIDNVSYGLVMTGTPKADARARAVEALEMVRMEGFAERKPDLLSGGQRQRVALARALVKKPKVLLLDEPLSALDAKLREAMQLELVRLQRSVGITFIVVTHDQNEALSMADRVAVMEHGRVCQVAPPVELYESPASAFVADFIGQINLFSAAVSGLDGDRLLLDVPRLGEIGIAGAPALSDAVKVAVRPEKITLSHEPPANGLSLRGTVTQIAYCGESSHVFLDNPTGVPLSVHIQNARRSTTARLRVGDQIWASWAAEDTLVLPDDDD